jgi:geranylgeranyl diphosphate synthase type I
VGFFLAFEMLSRLTSAPGPGGAGSRRGSAAAAPPERAWKILGLWAKELTAVGLAQMEDVALGASSRTGGEKEILNLYRYKTARYTFSIPLATGAIAAGRGPETVSGLEELGEDLGILFQMKDDEIGIFGEEAEIGKPPGSDIEEGKQTLIARVLSERGGVKYANIAARMRRRSADRSRGRSNDRPGERSGGAAGERPGAPPANLPGARSDLACLRALAEETGVLGSLERIREPIRVRAEELIESLGVLTEHKSFLRELLRYNLERRR